MRSRIGALSEALENEMLVEDLMVDLVDPTPGRGQDGTSGDPGSTESFHPGPHNPAAPPGPAVGRRADR